MKKISLKNLNLQGLEQLSPDQLKNVLGGDSGSGGTCCAKAYHADGTYREDCGVSRESAIYAANI